MVPEALQGWCSPAHSYCAAEFPQLLLIIMVTMIIMMIIVMVIIVMIIIIKAIFLIKRRRYQWLVIHPPGSSSSQGHPSEKLVTIAKTLDVLNTLNTLDVPNTPGTLDAPYGCEYRPQDCFMWGAAVGAYVGEKMQAACTGFFTQLKLSLLLSFSEMNAASVAEILKFNNNMINRKRLILLS